MSYTLHSVKKTFALLGGLFLIASIYATVMYYPLRRLCVFCVSVSGVR
jgi:hypothetical protein